MNHPSLLKILIVFLLPSFSALFAQQPVVGESEVASDFLLIGESVLNGVNNRDNELIVQYFDMDAFAVRVTEGLDLPDKFLRGYKVGLKAGLSQLGRNLFQNAPPNVANVGKIVRWRKVGDNYSFLLRIDLGDHGWYLGEFLCRRNEAGVAYIYDLYPLASAEFLSVTSRQMLVSVLPDQSQFLKVLGLEGSQDKAAKEIFQLIEAYSNQNFGVYAERYLAAGESSRKTKYLALLAYNVSTSLANETLALESLNDLRTYHGDDPKMAFALLDAYLMVEDYAAALKSFDYLNKFFGVEDAAILSMQANVYLLSGANFDLGLKCAERAVELEPTLEAGYWSLSSLAIEAKAYVKAIEGLKILESRFGYTFDPNYYRGEAGYIDFVNSDVFKSWAQER